MGLASLVYAVMALSLAYPALAGRTILNPRSDQYLAGYAFREFAAETLRSTGGFPLWNPYLQGGVPYVAGMAGDIFYPTFLLRLVMPTDQAMTWSFVIHLVLAGLFTFGFLRAVGLGFFPALVGGAAYLMSGNIAGLVSPGHDGKLYVSALFPLALWMIVRGVRDGRRWSWGVLALTVGLGVLTPHPQLLQYMLLGSGAFALFAAFAAWDGPALPRDVALRRLALAAAAIVLGFAMGAIQFWPVAEYVAWSPRSSGMMGGYEHAISYSMPPEELINAYLPQFSGILDEYWGRNGIHFHSDYLGAIVLMLAGAGLAGGAGGQRRRFAWFWAAAFVVALLWALGGYTPFYHLVYVLVPGTKFFRAPSTMLFALTLAVSVLAALGIERALAREVGTKYLVGWLIGGGVLALLATTGGLRGLALSLVGDERYEVVMAGAGSVTLGAWRSLLFLAIGAGILYGLRRGKLDARVAGWALVVALSADLWTILRSYWNFAPPASQLYATDATIEYLKQQSEPGRVLALPIGQGVVGRDVMLRGSGLMVHHVRQVLGYHGNELGRYQTLTGSNGDDVLQHLVNPNFLKLSNTRYLLSGLDQPPFPGSTRLAGPATSASGSTVYLYSVPGENPVAWLAPVIIKAPDAAVLATVLDQRFDVRRAALFDTSAAVTAKAAPAALPAAVAVNVRATRYEPGRISLALDGPAPEGSALIVSENYYPGWKAVADGRPAPIGRADYTLIGVELPAGARQVELSFESRTYEQGKLVTLLAIALAVLASVAGMIADRRGRRG